MTQSDQDNKKFESLSATSYQPQVAVDVIKAKPVSSGKKVNWRRIGLGIVITLVVALITTLVLAAWNLRNLSLASQKLFGQSNMLGVFSPTTLEKDSNGRTNLLIIGNAGDRPEHGGADLTDTLLILSLAQDDSGYMLSIPRDLYTEIPGYGIGRINEAFPAGEQNSFSESGYSNGGAGLLEKMIDDNFGIDIHYHAIVSFTAVEDIVDALGGITVEIDSSDTRGLLDPNFKPEEGGPLRLKNGAQEIDGQTALKLSRARGSTGAGYGFPQSDFTRTVHQQKIIAAITEQLSWKLAFNPYKNAQVLGAVADNTVTDVTLNEAVPIYRLLVRTQTEKLHSYTLRDIEGTSLLVGYVTPDGSAVQIPSGGFGYYQDIKDAIEQVSR